MSRQPKAEGRQAGTHSGVGRRTRIVVHLMSRQQRCLSTHSAQTTTTLHAATSQCSLGLGLVPGSRESGFSHTSLSTPSQSPSLSVPAHFIMILPRYLLLLLPPPPLSPLPASLLPSLPNLSFFLSFHWFLTAPFAPVPPSSTRHTLADWFRRGNNLRFVSAYLTGCQHDVAMSARSSRVD